MSSPRVGPNVGSNQGARQQWWQLHVVVVVVDGGGGERRDGMVMMCDASDVSTTVARFGNLRVPII